MPCYLTPWQLDESELRLDSLLSSLRVNSSFDKYLKTYFQSIVTLIINEGKMANAKSSKTTNQPALVWVNTQLSPEHIDAFTNDQRTESEILNGLLALAGSGYELALKHDPSAKCWRAYLFDKTDGQAVHYGLSCFASTPSDTLNLLLFKFYVVLGGEWPDPDTEAAKPKFG